MKKYLDRLEEIIDALMEIMFIAVQLLAILGAIWFSTKILCSLADAQEPPAIAPPVIEQTAEDCSGGIKGNRLDIYFDDHQAALQFGAQSAMVYVEAA